METRLPEEKVAKIVKLLLNFPRRRKGTLRELQSLLGLLNYATGCIVLGRTYLRRLYDLTFGITCPHYKIRLTNDARADLAAWVLFMQSFNGRCMFCMTSGHRRIWCAYILMLLQQLDMRVFSMIIGLRCAGLLSFQIITLMCWNYFQLLLLLKCGGQNGDSKQMFLSDNEATVHVINNMTSRDKIMMRLAGRLVVAAMRFNIVFWSEHILGKTNTVVDFLSRFKVQEARMCAPYLAQFPCAIPDNLFKI